MMYNELVRLLTNRSDLVNDVMWAMLDKGMYLVHNDYKHSKVGALASTILEGFGMLDDVLGDEIKKVVYIDRFINECVKFEIETLELDKDYTDKVAAICKHYKECDISEVIEKYSEYYLY